MSVQPYYESDSAEEIRMTSIPLSVQPYDDLDSVEESRRTRIPSPASENVKDRTSSPVEREFVEVQLHYPDDIVHPEEKYVAIERNASGHEHPKSPTLSNDSVEEFLHRPPPSGQSASVTGHGRAWTVPSSGSGYSTRIQSVTEPVPSLPSSSFQPYPGGNYPAVPFPYSNAPPVAPSYGMPSAVQAGTSIALQSYQTRWPTHYGPSHYPPAPHQGSSTSMQDKRRRSRPKMQTASGAAGPAFSSNLDDASDAESHHTSGRSRPLGSSHTPKTAQKSQVASETSDPLKRYIAEANFAFEYELGRIFWSGTPELYQKVIEAHKSKEAEKLKLRQVRNQKPDQEAIPGREQTESSEAPIERPPSPASSTKPDIRYYEEEYTGNYNSAPGHYAPYHYPYPSYGYPTYPYHTHHYPSYPYSNQQAPSAVPPTWHQHHAYGQTPQYPPWSPVDSSTSRRDPQQEHDGVRAQEELLHRIDKLMKEKAIDDDDDKKRAEEQDREFTAQLDQFKAAARSAAEAEVRREAAEASKARAEAEEMRLAEVKEAIREALNAKEDDARIQAVAQQAAEIEYHRSRAEAKAEALREIAEAEQLKEDATAEALSKISSAQEQAAAIRDQVAQAIQAERRRAAIARSQEDRIRLEAKVAALKEASVIADRQELIYLKALQINEDKDRIAMAYAERQRQMYFDVFRDMAAQGRRGGGAGGQMLWSPPGSGQKLHAPRQQRYPLRMPGDRRTTKEVEWVSEDDDDSIGLLPPPPHPMRNTTGGGGGGPGSTKSRRSMTTNSSYWRSVRKSRRVLGKANTLSASTSSVGGVVPPAAPTVSDVDVDVDVESPGLEMEPMLALRESEQRRRGSSVGVQQSLDLERPRLDHGLSAERVALLQV